MRDGQRVSDLDLAVGRRLAAMRNEAGLTQVEVGRRLGFAQSRIAKLEIGTRRLLFSEAIAIAELYGVTLSAFVSEPAVDKRKRTPGGSGRPAKREPKRRVGVMQSAG